MKCCMNGTNYIELLFLYFNFKTVVKFCVHISPIFSCPVTYEELANKNAFTTLQNANE